MRDSYGEPSMFAGIMTQLDRLNKIDALTHLFNRHELNKAGREKIKDKAVDSLALMILDIDDFKNVNELYDRSFGDKVLKSTAQMIQSNLPGNASLYKLDNDQMGVLIENCQIEDIHNRPFKSNYYDNSFKNIMIVKYKFQQVVRWHL